MNHTVLDKVPNWTVLTDQEILDYLVTSDPIRIKEPESLVTIKRLGDLFDPVQVEQVVATLEAVGFKAFASALASTGLDFGNPKLQTQLDVLASNPQTSAVFTKELVDALKALGVDSRSPWQRQYGIDATSPTLAEVTAARTQRELIDWYHARSEYVKDLVTNGTVTTQQAAAASLLTDVE